MNFGELSKLEINPAGQKYLVCYYDETENYDLVIKKAKAKFKIDETERIQILCLPKKGKRP